MVNQKNKIVPDAVNFNNCDVTQARANIYIEPWWVVLTAKHGGMGFCYCFVHLLNFENG